MEVTLDRRGRGGEGIKQHITEAKQWLQSPIQPEYSVEHYLEDE